MYKVVFYCPDKHIEYDGRTPYKTGVGGGITARIRMARALARAGHEVTMVVNCRRRARIAGVEYVPLPKCRKIQGDVLIANTSGGEMDLRPILDLDVDVRLRLVWAHGTIKPQGLEDVNFDCLYAVSNFVADVAHNEWGVPREQLFVAYNAYEEEMFSRTEHRRPVRDPYRLVYFSHPSKGLDTAIAVLERLRDVDQRFHLVVFGGPRLWGGKETETQYEGGVIYKGLIGQRELAGELLQCSYAIHLQDREEPGALAIVEAMRAGCIIIGSPVGCYLEYIENSRDAFLIPGSHNSPEVQERVSSLILSLKRNPEALVYLRRNAQCVIWDSDTMARVWTVHWDWWLDGAVGDGINDRALGHCQSCRGECLLLADGYHCIACGRYARAGY